MSYKIGQTHSAFSKVPHSGIDWKFQRCCQHQQNIHQAYVTNADRKPNLCPVCEKAHLIHQCPEFLNLTAESRLAQAKKLHLCFNCLNQNHSLTECRSGCCRHCHQKHYSLLHLGKIKTEPPLNKDTLRISTAHCSTEKSAPATDDSLVVIGSHTINCSIACFWSVCNPESSKNLCTYCFPSNTAPTSSLYSYEK
jgi:hypothetical protein